MKKIIIKNSQIQPNSRPSYRYSISALLPIPEAPIVLGLLRKSPLKSMGQEGPEVWELKA